MKKFAMLALGELVIGSAGAQCTGGSGGTGSLKVMITDKPYPYEWIEEALVTITKVEVSDFSFRHRVRAPAVSSIRASQVRAWPVD